MSAPSLPLLDTAAVQRALDDAIDEAVVGALIRVAGRRGLLDPAGVPSRPAVNEGKLNRPLTDPVPSGMTVR
jgi:hypothetical protein